MGLRFFFRRGASPSVEAAEAAAGAAGGKEAASPDTAPPPVAGTPELAAGSRNTTAELQVPSPNAGGCGEAETGCTGAPPPADTGLGEASCCPAGVPGGKSPPSPPPTAAPPQPPDFAAGRKAPMTGAGVKLLTLAVIGTEVVSEAAPPKPGLRCPGEKLGVIPASPLRPNSRKSNSVDLPEAAPLPIGIGAEVAPAMVCPFCNC